MPRVLKQGAGWRIGWHPEAPEFKGLVGGDGWAIELTEPELNDFCRLSQQLQDTMAQIAEELMAEETIACEAESDRLWLEVRGYPQAYGLQLMLLTGRRAEGSWPAAVVPELLQAAQTIGVF